MFSLPCTVCGPVTFHTLLLLFLSTYLQSPLLSPAAVASCTSTTRPPWFPPCVPVTPPSSPLVPSPPRSPSLQPPCCVLAPGGDRRQPGRSPAALPIALPAGPESADVLRYCCVVGTWHLPHHILNLLLPVREPQDENSSPLAGFSPTGTHTSPPAHARPCCRVWAPLSPNNPPDRGLVPSCSWSGACSSRPP